MKAEIISIGSELTSGQNLDTNSQWLSRRLAEMGIPVHWHTTLADDLADNVQAFQIAQRRAKLVLITGGLGPTQDDLTREALAKAAGVELVFHEESLEQIQRMFARVARTMPERNRVQALFPAGSEPIPNARGTAPGIWMEVRAWESESVGAWERETVRAPEGSAATFSPSRSPTLPLSHSSTLFVALPGVPNEMFAMFDAAVKPRLQPMYAGGVVVQRKINCFGAGESAIEERLLDLTRRGHLPEVGITVGDATISLRILAKAADVETARRQIEPVERTIRERLGNLVFGVEEEDLQDAVARLLEEKQQTLATAESVTGGLVAYRLTQVPGISRFFCGGLVAYTNDVKTAWLGLPQRLIDEHGVISAPVVEALATACRSRFQADLAVSTVGLAGPGGADAGHPLGLAFAGLAWKDGVRSQRYHWGGTRLEIQSRTAKLALNMVRLHLLELA